MKWNERNAKRTTENAKAAEESARVERRKRAQREPHIECVCGRMACLAGQQKKHALSGVVKFFLFLLFMCAWQMAWRKNK